MKYIIIFINALAIAIYHLVFGDPVTATVKVPDGITAGGSFMIEVTVNKPQVTGFAKLQIELPPSFVATEGDSKGGAFTASGTFVKIIWTSVPADDQITVQINVAVPASATAGKQLKGKFSYISDNAKQEVNFDPINLNITGNSSDAVVTNNTSNDATTTDVTNTSSDPLNQPAKEPDATTVTTTEPVANNQSSTNADNQQPISRSAEPDAVVSVSRKITSSSTPDNFQVDLTIKKGNIKGFAKLSEKIPAGYKADAINIAGASFAFENSEAKFIWTSIPAVEELQISYNLIPDGANIEKPAYIDGSRFSYLENDQTKKILLDKQEIANGESSAAVASNTLPDSTSTTIPPPTDNNTSVATTTAVAPKSGNIHYSVQIGAFQKSVNANYLKKKYAIKETVRTEMHDGYTKCIIGSYNEYKIARDNRELVKNKGVSDAFVTAYNSGKRITVQEALMVSNQKWYR